MSAKGEGQPVPQISETLQSYSVNLGDVKMPVSELTGGVLILGQTGCGKTQTVINPLAVQFAALGESKSDHFAIVYFGTKGSGHLDFLNSLPPERAKDVVKISSDGPAVRLFLRDNWASQRDLNLAVVDFIEEVAEHVAQAGGSYRHDVFWDRQRKRVLGALCALTTIHSDEDIPASVRELHHADAFVSLLRRLEAFLEYVGTKSSGT